MRLTAVNQSYVFHETMSGCKNLKACFDNLNIKIYFDLSSYFELAGLGLSKADCIFRFCYLYMVYEQSKYLCRFQTVGI